jgi:hypothetical protein
VAVPSNIYTTRQQIDWIAVALLRKKEMVRKNKGLFDRSAPGGGLLRSLCEV